MKNPSKEAVIRRLQGHRDSRGLVGSVSRGKNRYGFAGSSAAHRGGGIQYGRPKGRKDKVPHMSAVRRRLAHRRK